MVRSAIAEHHEPDALLVDALARVEEAEATLRAIGAGEIDAFVVSDPDGGRRVFSLSTADLPYRMFVESMRDGAATVTPDGLVLYANDRLAELLACPREALLGATLASLASPTSVAGLEELRACEGANLDREIDLVNLHGQTVPVVVGASHLDVDGQRVTCLTFTDMSAMRAQDLEIARVQAALKRQATHDALTGLPNRDLLVDRIDTALAQARRSGRHTAVFFVDLDRFKLVNDTQGHAVGNAVLRRVAGQLRDVLRSMDTVARIGGDEFVVLAPDVAGHEHAATLGARMVDTLCHHGTRSGDGIPVSIGISVSVGGRGTAEALLHEADMAMYHAKSLGGRRAELFADGLARQAEARGSARHTLQAALDERRLVAFYQPIVDVPTGAVRGYEALARIRQLDGSILAPAGFIPIAEESGLVVPMGEQVLRLACGEASRWAGSPADASLAVAVNLSPLQLEPGDLPEILRRALLESALEPGRLHLELTETAIMDLRPDILRQLGAIRDLGVEIGLDDFGTGYASLTHLRHLPLSFVKIDQSFVGGLGEEGWDERIVAAVVDLARNLELRSVAEGVETPEQLEHLRELGCDQAQGYHFGRPAPPELLERCAPAKS